MNLRGDLMPWNIPEQGSRTGSVLSFGDFRTSSIGGIPSSINKHFSSAGRRKASPTVGTSRLLGKRASRVTPSPSVRQTRVPFSDFGATIRHGSSTNMEPDGDDVIGVEEMIFHDLHKGTLIVEELGQCKSRKLRL